MAPISFPGCSLFCIQLPSPSHHRGSQLSTRDQGHQEALWCTDSFQKSIRPKQRRKPPRENLLGVEHSAKPSSQTMLRENCELGMVISTILQRRDLPKGKEQPGGLGFQCGTCVPCSPQVTRAVSLQDYQGCVVGFPIPRCPPLR